MGGGGGEGGEGDLHLNRKYKVYLDKKITYSKLYNKIKLLKYGVLFVYYLHPYL